MAAYRVAVIGTGGISRTHGNYYQSHPQTEIVAAADINPEALDSFCDQFSVPAKYTDYSELLAVEKPDIVSVCTWQGTHAEITVAAAQAGAKGILCEKPMATDMAGAEAMMKACDERGVKLAIHHQTRFRPAFPAARKAITEGLIGQPLAALCRVRDGLTNIGSHTIDIARYVLGDPQWTWVLGQAERSTNRHERGEPIEDLCGAIVGLEDGARIVLECDLPDTQEKVYRIIVGTEGMVRLAGEAALLTSVGTDGWQPLPTEPQPGFLDEFIAWIEGGPEHRCSARQARQAHEVMMALYESARTRRLIRPPLANTASALMQMIEDGTMAVPDQPRYDIRSEAALKYCFPDE